MLFLPWCKPPTASNIQKDARILEMVLYPRGLGKKGPSLGNIQCKQINGCCSVEDFARPSTWKVHLGLYFRSDDATPMLRLP